MAAPDPNAYPFPDLKAQPPPWDYNPSAWRQRVVICLIAMIGVIVSVYMGLYQWRLISGVWDPFFGGQTLRVLDSDVSHAITKYVLVPDAVLGATAYLGDVLFSLAGSTRRWQYRPWMVMIFGFDVIPLGVVSAILVMMQAVVVGYWCFLCLVSAVVSVVLIYFAYDEVWSSIQYLRAVRSEAKARGDTKAFRHTFWGKPTDLGHEVAERMLRQWNEEGKTKQFRGRT